MRIVSKLTERQVAQLHELYQHEWWCKGRTLAETRACVSHSQIIIGVVDDNDDLAGFARVLTDTVFKALIFDVIVASRHRGNKLGNLLVHAIKNHERLRNVKHFELYCKPDMVPFYEAHGFSGDVGDIELMRWENTHPIPGS